MRLYLEKTKKKLILLKILKCRFSSPREFTDLLKAHMTVANVNKTLMANMFHVDFRYHLKAIETLLEDLPSNSKALISNFDVNVCQPTPQRALKEIAPYI